MKQEVSNIPLTLKAEMKEELGYDSDLVVDDEDEKQLDKMPELKREQVIEERRQKRLQIIERYRLIQ